MTNTHTHPLHGWIDTILKDHADTEKYYPEEVGSYRIIQASRHEDIVNVIREVRRKSFEQNFDCEVYEQGDDIVLIAYRMNLSDNDF